ncbi:MAG TPA: translation initiation factor IF-5A [Candidatus Nanoarchaeia archaeon]|nr:translation initiation factor IF-5A [Candidatus Nanoarchaeia archaeon]
MSTKQEDATSVKEGMTVVLDGAACKIVNVSTSRPGKHGHAKVRMEGVGLIDGKKRILVMPGSESVDIPIIEKKTAQVLSVTGKSANVMDTESFEMFDLPIPDDLMGEVKENTQVLYWIILSDRVMKQVKSG